MLGATRGRRARRLRRAILEGSTREFPKIGGTLFGGPHNKDPTISGTILGSPIFGNSRQGLYKGSVGFYKVSVVVL